MLACSIDNEVKHCDFGDARLKVRVHSIAQCLSEKPNMSIPSACNSRAEVEATYRFFDNSNVTPDEILASHALASLERVRSSKVALLVQDTTEIDLTRPESIVSGAGPLSSDKQLGALYHPLMAFSETGVPLGTVWSKRWVRESIHKELTPDEKEKARKKLPISQKESFRWIQGVRAAKSVAESCPDTLCVCIGDSEADIYDLFAEPLETEHGQLHLLIRGCQDRVVNDDPCIKILQAVRSMPVIAEQRIDISKRTQKKSVGENKKRKLSREARTAEVSIRATTVKIARPSGNSSAVKEVELNVVLVEEINPPEGQVPIQWFLLTTLPIGTVEEVQRIIEYYCHRWQIEIYFRTLKSGCRIEERYFERITRLENALAIYSIIAWRILYLCRLGEDCPDMSCEVVFSPSEWKPVVMVVHRKEPTTPPRLKEMIKMVASLGGYVIRGTTRPGTQTLWLGLQRVHDLADAWETFGPDTRKSKNISP
jgi:hypothetical protein